MADHDKPPDDGDTLYSWGWDDEDPEEYLTEEEEQEFEERMARAAALAALPPGGSVLSMFGCEDDDYEIVALDAWYRRGGVRPPCDSGTPVRVEDAPAGSRVRWWSEGLPPERCRHPEDKKFEADLRAGAWSTAAGTVEESDGTKVVRVPHGPVSTRWVVAGGTGA